MTHDGSPRRALTRRDYLALFVLIISIGSAVAAVSNGRWERYGLGSEHERALSGYFLEHHVTRLDISPEHYPSPGKCRIWFFKLPADVQPPAGDCKDLARRIPAGAWLIRHPNDGVDRVQVTIYDPRKPGETAIAVGVFDMHNGNLLRELPL